MPWCWCRSSSCSRRPGAPSRAWALGCRGSRRRAPSPPRSGRRARLDGESGFEAALDTLRRDPAARARALGRRMDASRSARIRARGRARRDDGARARPCRRVDLSFFSARMVASGAQCARRRRRRARRPREAARPDRRRMGRQRARGVVDRSPVRPSPFGVDRDPGGRRRPARPRAPCPGRRSRARRRHRRAARPAVHGARARARRGAARARALRRLRGRGVGCGRAGARSSRPRRTAGRARRARPRSRAPRARAARARRRAHRRRDGMEDVDDARRRERDVAVAGGAPGRQRRRVPRLAQVLAADGDARGGLARRARGGLSALARLAPRRRRVRRAAGRRGPAARGSDGHARRDRGHLAAPSCRRGSTRCTRRSSAGACSRSCATTTPAARRSPRSASSRRSRLRAAPRSPTTSSP